MYMDTLNEWMSFLGCAKRIDNYKKSILKEVDPNYVQDLYEIKGIHEVTIVNTVPGSTSTDKANHYATLFIKFELTGGKDPVIFKESILIPSMITIPGLSIVYVGDMRPIERD